MPQLSFPPRFCNLNQCVFLEVDRGGVRPTQVSESVKGMNDFSVNFKGSTGNVAFIEEYAAFLGIDFHRPS